MYNTRLLNSKISRTDIEESAKYDIDISNYNMIAYTNKSLINYLHMIDGKWSPLYSNCNAETINRFYDSKGDVYSCTLAVGDIDARVGTYYPESKIFENNMLKRNISTIPKCKECIYRYVCGGGCAYDALKRCGNFNSCNCERFKDVLEKAIPEAILTRLSNKNLEEEG